MFFWPIAIALLLVVIDVRMLSSAAAVRHCRDICGAAR